MSESNPVQPDLSLVPSILADMQRELEQARASGRNPVEWLVRLEMMDALCKRAGDEGVLSGEIAHIYGIKARGSWKMLQPGDLPVLVCEGDEMHCAIRAMYEEPAS
jgi:hypothetical protein